MRIALLILVVALSASPATAQGKIPVLVVSGANNHDWEWTTPSLVSMLDETGRFDVTVTYEPGKTLADAEGIAAFDAFVLDYNGPRWGEAAERNFLAAVRGGTGVAVIHAANNAFEGWVEYETLVGDLWRSGTGHGRFHAFDVEVTDRDHPITRTLPDLRAHSDELYHDLARTPGTDHRVLASALSAKETGGTGEQEPMILVAEFGEGRVFHTPLGHVWKGVEDSRASHTDSQFRNLVVRGTEWAATGHVTDGLARPNHLTSLEREAGWRLLFDGETTEGWRGWRRDGFPDKGWVVEAGCIRHVNKGGGGDIVTVGTYTDFELELEWKVAAGANSGVKYRAVEVEGGGGPIAPEFQVLDDERHPDARSGVHAAGALYAVIAAEGVTLAPVGAFNHSRIVARGNRIEHWVNGVRVAETEVGSEAWNAAKAKSKFRGADDFAAPKAGHILLQDHGDEVWFRSIRIRDLANLPGEPVDLIGDDDLSAWTPLGDASYTLVDGDTILGAVTGGKQSFLATQREYGDFLFEVDVRLDERGNSGIQVRSGVRPNGRMFGYQIEIDPSDRAWSGGLFDESRRGWLQNLKENEAGRQAFDADGWNRYRIECIGPSIRAWVNGVPTADYVDAMTIVGQLGLQVHSGARGKIRWRNPRLRDLGRRVWIPLLENGSASGLVEHGSSLTTHDEMSELTLRVVATEPIRIGFGPDTATTFPGPGSRPFSPTDGGWWVDFGHPDCHGALRDGADTFDVSFYGDRVVAQVNGKLVVDERLANPLPVGRLSLGSASVESVYLLGEPAE